MRYKLDDADGASLSIFACGIKTSKKNLWEKFG